VKQFKFFTNSLWSEFGTGIILLAIPGVYLLSKSNLKIYYFTLLTFFGCVFYSVNYDIHDIASYFLLANITAAIWIGFGGVWLYGKLAEYLGKESGRTGFAVVLILVSLITLITNYTENDESKNTYVEEFTMNIFRNVKPGGIVISSQWDFWVSASWYYQFVKNIRPDIVVIDKELLRRSWYFKFIERTHPGIYNNSKAEIDRFLIELDKFEHGVPYDQRTIMKAFSDMLTSFVTKNQGRNIYTTWEIEQNKNEPFAENYVRVPDGILFQLVHKDSLQNNVIKDYGIYDFEFTPTRVKDYYHETLMLSYSAMLTSSAQYLLNLNRPGDAKKYLDLALTAIPGFPNALDLKRKFNL
jgi:SAM-dependent methyltransferase